MNFVNRHLEFSRLNRVMALDSSALIVIWGRRRVGKTRLLLEWVEQKKGIYWVADESSPVFQRKNFAVSLDKKFPGFSQVDYPDWGALLNRIAKESLQGGWRGPLVIDELPYLLEVSPELPSVLQRWIDHEAKKANLVVVLSGSSQRMMQDAVLKSSSPLFGRAKEIIQLRPLLPFYLGEALRLKDPRIIIEAFGIWGGIPRYWELLEGYSDLVFEAAEALVLDPLGPLHREPYHLLLEEAPSAISLKPILDVIGLGAHRLSEIANRLQLPVTSLSRPIQKLQELGLVERELPFGSHEGTSKRALYHILDPFLRFWFEGVAPRRSLLLQSSKKMRMVWLRERVPHLLAQSWESLCRLAVPHLGTSFRGISFLPARRFWQGQGPEWDVVAWSVDKKKILLGEVKWTQQMPTAFFLKKTLAALRARGLPPVEIGPEVQVVYALFVPEKPRLKKQEGVFLIEAKEVIQALR